jgi:hypothetical protein
MLRRSSARTRPRLEQCVAAETCVGRCGTVAVRHSPALKAALCARCKHLHAQLPWHNDEAILRRNTPQTLCIFLSEARRGIMASWNHGHGFAWLSVQHRSVCSAFCFCGAASISASTFLVKFAAVLLVRLLVGRLRMACRMKCWNVASCSLEQTKPSGLGVPGSNNLWSWAQRSGCKLRPRMTVNDGVAAATCRWVQTACLQQADQQNYLDREVSLPWR